MPLFNGYGSTYQPNYEKGQQQNPYGGVGIKEQAAPTSNPLFSNSGGGGGGGAPSGGGMPGMAPAINSGSNPVGVNFAPGSTTPIANPGTSVVGATSGMPSPNAPASGSNSQTYGANLPVNGQQWANPLTQLTQYMTSQLHPYGQPQPGPSQAPGQNIINSSAPSSGSSNQTYGAYTGAQPPLGGLGLGPQLQPANMTNNNGAVTRLNSMASPQGLQDLISNLTPEQMEMLGPSFKNMMQKTMQSYSNSYANPNYSGPGGAPGGGGAGTQTDPTQIQNWMSNAYNTYVQKMNQYHLY